MCGLTRLQHHSSCNPSHLLRAILPELNASLKKIAIAIDSSRLTGILDHTTTSEVTMHIDLSNQSPVFKQIADYLRSNIAAGIFRPDEALPSKRALAEKLGVNPLTVQNAYMVLEREQLVVARKGVGMFVAKRGVGRAQTRSEQDCYDRLVQALRMAREADLPEAQIRTLIDKALEETSAFVAKRD
jgi:GntR family transcriptional regulator